MKEARQQDEVAPEPRPVPPTLFLALFGGFVDSLLKPVLCPSPVASIGLNPTADTLPPNTHTQESTAQALSHTSRPLLRVPTTTFRVVPVQASDREQVLERALHLPVGPKSWAQPAWATLVLIISVSERSQHTPSTPKRLLPEDAKCVCVCVVGGTAATPKALVTPPPPLTRVTPGLLEPKVRLGEAQHRENSLRPGGHSRPLPPEPPRGIPPLPHLRPPPRSPTSRRRREKHSGRREGAGRKPAPESQSREPGRAGTFS